ncbi:hypothetical protein DSM104299_03986 [Baekduia alba]|uniref:hypothetical protein n=1 Tax=Baekduia alba TaxID=2997333 RepID=UPI0023423AB8|nr:hypothetical protein [Baekduia alba]WCB95243.1 hypothetical protein DSM104299_03986 [Baekduia alba]
MTRTIDRCGAPQGCVRHALLALSATPDADAAAARRGLAELAGRLEAARSGAPRQELAACGELLAAAFTADRSGAPDSFRLDVALARGSGAPLILGAVAVNAARDAGIALGLLAGPAGRLVVAHAMLSRPLVLDLADDFAPRDIGGEEALHRWLCAHETARRVGAQVRSADADAAPLRCAAAAAV